MYPFNKIRMHLYKIYWNRLLCRLTAITPITFISCKSALPLTLNLPRATKSTPHKILLQSPNLSKLISYSLIKSELSIMAQISPVGITTISTFLSTNLPTRRNRSSESFEKDMHLVKTQQQANSTLWTILSRNSSADYECLWERRPWTQRNSWTLPLKSREVKLGMT